jgi:hypothetical protein
MREASSPKGHWPALTQTEQIGGLRLRLYELYGDDHEVRGGINSLIAAWWDTVGPRLRRCPPDPRETWNDRFEPFGRPGQELAYLDHVAYFARAVGLNRIREVPCDPEPLASGESLLHVLLWRLDRHRLAEAARSRNRSLPEEPPPTFVQVASFWTSIPSVDIAVGNGAQWNPRSETLADARPRLAGETGLPREHLDAELRRIVEEGEYLLPDTSTSRGGIPRLERDALWTYWRIRHRWTHTEIAAHWAALHPADTVSTARGDGLARAWEREHRGQEREVTDARDVAHQVRDAISRYGRLADIDVSTGPGRPRSRDPDGQARGSGRSRA